MKAQPNEIGQVVTSKQGHDKGRKFLIVGLVDEKHVLIADGATRKLSHPKKKQLKHLRAEPLIAHDVIDVIAKQAQSADSALRKALLALTFEHPLRPDGAQRMTNKEEYALVQE